MAIDMTYDEVANATIGKQKKPVPVTPAAPVMRAAPPTQLPASNLAADPVAAQSPVVAPPSPVVQPTAITTPTVASQQLQDGKGLAQGQNPDGSIKYAAITPNQVGPLGIAQQVVSAAYNKIIPGQDVSARLAQNRAGLDSSGETVASVPPPVALPTGSAAPKATVANESQSPVAPEASEAYKKSFGIGDLSVVGTHKFADPQGKAFDAYANAGMNTVKLSGGRSAVLGQSEADAATDARFAAAGTQKDAYGNWLSPERIADKERLKNMQYENAKFNATSPEITDQKVRNAGLRGMAVFDAEQKQLAGQADSTLKQAQAKGIMATTESAQGIADLQKKALAGDPQAIANYQMLTGKEEKYKDRYIPMNNRKVYNDMGQIVDEVSGGLYDAKTGKTVAGDGQKKAAPSQADLEHTAKKHGISVEQVKARLAQQQEGK